MIEIKNLSKYYGTKKAVDDISFNVDKGEIVGFLGPNGAGKTTTMNMITGYISLSGGSIKIDGFDILKNPKECKKRIGYLPEQPPLYMDMTVLEYLEFVYDIKGVKEPKKDHLAQILHMVRIDDVKGRLIRNLSKGYKQRVGIAQALVGNPEILILDEPTVGLDPKQIIEIRKVISELGRDRTIILSSHILAEISAICEKVIIINNGSVMAIGSPDELSGKITPRNILELRIMGEREEIRKVLEGIDALQNIKLIGQREKGSFDFEIEMEHDSDIRAEIFRELSKNDMPIIMQKSSSLTLEEVFLRLTSEGAKPIEKKEEN